MLLEDFQNKYRYIGNCTNSHMADGLEDMMDKAKEISYNALVAAVGREQLAHTFPDFDWSARPRNLTMRADYAVSYYKSWFKGMLCYYVRESGVEFIFCDETASKKSPRKNNTMVVTQDGKVETLSASSNNTIYSMQNKRPGVVEVSQSTASNPVAKQALTDWLLKGGVDTVIEDGEKYPLGEFLANL